VRSIKGRLQYLLRDKIPKFWRRHYSITSVGDANNAVLQVYVGGQMEHHPVADPRTVERLCEVQFHDPSVDLATERASSHGRFIHNLHIVLENADHLPDTRKEWLTTSRDMVVAACRKKRDGCSRVSVWWPIICTCCWDATWPTRRERSHFP
jgi:hypothetical protein